MKMVEEGRKGESQVLTKDYLLFLSQSTWNIKYRVEKRKGNGSQKVTMELEFLFFYFSLLMFLIFLLRENKITLTPFHVHPHLYRDDNVFEGYCI